MSYNAAALRTLDSEVSVPRVTISLAIIYWPVSALSPHGATGAFKGYDGPLPSLAAVIPRSDLELHNEADSIRKTSPLPV